MTMEATPFIELREVTAHRGAAVVLSEVSFSIYTGLTTVLMGTAGSGKSSVLKAAAGIFVPDSGDILVRGKSIGAFSRKEELEFRHRSGFVFQDAALWSNQNLFENLALPIRFHDPRRSRAEVEKAVRAAMTLVGCDEELSHRPAELSSGERKLVGFARAMVLDPELIFMDEPSSSLDEESAERISVIIAGLKAQRRTIVIVTSSSDLASRVADRVGVIKAGKIIAFGSYAEAVQWSDPALRSVIGRLKPRSCQEEPAAIGLVSAWADALAETATETIGSTAFDGAGEGGDGRESRESYESIAGHESSSAQGESGEGYENAADEVASGENGKAEGDDCVDLPWDAKGEKL